MPATKTVEEALAAAEDATSEQDVALVVYKAAKAAEDRGDTEGSRQETADALDAYIVAQARAECLWADHDALADAADCAA